MTVDFDPATHTYRVDGVKVPSVTQLVAPLGADYDEPDDMTENIIDAATDRGTTLHAYLEHRLYGGSREDFELPDIYEAYADAADLFLAEHEIVPLCVEQPMPGNGFAGTPDLVCEFDGTAAIVDYKFVSQLAKSKVGAQLAGYRKLCEENGIYVDFLFAVQFLKDGTYRLYPVDGFEARIWFGICVEVHDLKTRKHPRGRIG